MKRVAVIVAGTLGAAAFAFPSLGFATTHSPQGHAARCQALATKYNKIYAASVTAGPNAQPILQALAAQALAKYNAECP